MYREGTPPQHTFDDLCDLIHESKLQKIELVLTVTPTGRQVKIQQEVRGKIKNLVTTHGFLAEQSLDEIARHMMEELARETLKAEY